MFACILLKEKRGETFSRHLRVKIKFNTRSQFVSWDHNNERNGKNGDKSILIYNTIISLAARMSQ